jgi:predicted anti-sigma-YlaC factor YlaD
MKCDEAAMIFLDDRAHRTAEIDAHLASCSGCRGVLLTDARARELGRWDKAPSLPAAFEPSRLQWRRRARLALTAAGLVAMGALAAVAVSGPRAGALWSGNSEIVLPEAARAATETEPLRTAANAPADAATSEGDESLIDDLLVESIAYARREVSVRDPLYAAFGDLPRWVSLPANRSLEAPVFQKALHPIHSDLEVHR